MQGNYENGAFGPLPVLDPNGNPKGTSYNHYGQRGTEDGVVSGGQVHGNGVVQEKVVYVTGADFVNAGAVFQTQLTIPAGSKFLEAQAEVNEAFDLGGTTPTINVGTSGSSQTNYVIEIDEASAEAVDTVVYNAVGAGDYAAPLTADAAIEVSLGGTTPTSTDEGKIKVVIRYIKI